jgi:hypothetical protein
MTNEQLQEVIKIIGKQQIQTHKLLLSTIEQKDSFNKGLIRYLSVSTQLPPEIKEQFLNAISKEESCLEKCQAEINQFEKTFEEFLKL